LIIALTLSAFALSFAFAPFGARFLSYVTLIPLLVTIYKYNYKKVFLYGFLFGVVFALFHLWWLYFLIVPVEPATKILLYLGVTILFGYLALYTAVFSIATKFLGLAFAPLVWVALEFIRTKSEIGFPWGLLGYSQISHTSIVQISSIFGVYGLSAWLVWINLLIFWIFQKKHKLTYLVILIISFVLPIGYGLMRIKEKPSVLKVAVVQPNIAPNEKGDRESRNRLIDELLALIRNAANQKPDLIILPETATIIDITKSEDLRITIQSIIDTNNVYLFTGTPLFEPGGSVYYNGAVLFEPNVVGLDSVIYTDSTHYVPVSNFDKIYRKIHLVPFSERIPYVDKIGLVRKIETGDMGDCTPGKEYTVFEIQIPNSQIPNKFACLICFEAIFPDLAHEFTSRGADMLINITNDGWFGKTPGPYQHCELAVMRSVENGVPLIRSANNGISLITDSYARIKNRTGLFTQTVLIDSVPSPLTSTFYRTYGDIFIYIALGIIIIVILVKPFKHKNNQKRIS
jgi:apolipoprotein N-acyltransferase